MPRAVTCVVLLASALQAQDVVSMIRRAAGQYERDLADSGEYSYLQRQETRELDRSGQVQNRRIETVEITFLDGSPYRRLVRRNDQPISADEQKAEEEKMRWTGDQRRMETAEQRARRVAEYQRRHDRQEEPAKEVADAFNFTLLGEQPYAGRTVYRIEGSPKTGFRPKSQYAALFSKAKLRLWIDKQQYQVVRVELEMLDSISFGGFLVRLNKGSRLVIEQAPAPDGVWHTARFSLTAAARILLVKGLNRELDFSFSDYHKVAPLPDAVALNTR